MIITDLLYPEVISDCGVIDYDAAYFDEVI